MPVAAAVLLVALTGVLWWLAGPDDRPGRQAAAPGVGGTAAPAGKPSAGASSGAVAPVPTGPDGAPVPGAVDATAPGADGVTGRPPLAPGLSPPPGGGTAPTTTTPVPDPEPTATTTAPPTDPPAAEERTFTSPAGSVRATCPSASTAKLLSYSATRPYKLDDVDEGPGDSVGAVFKRGNSVVRMTVTCADGVPSSSTD
ncbi:hypothetical protein GCM10020358_43240 [Amorphoplanes nipponensis]|uniref:hypothetical protein n=1 Tax=Actinoplanes nipponensis TaxID=135950 RepID=UPI0031F0D327